MQFIKVFLTGAIGICLSSCVLFKGNNKSNVGVSHSSTTLVKKDTTKKASDTTRKVKPYTEVITAKAITDSGLFIIHRIGDRYFFEIPNSLLDKEILIVSRINKAAADNRPLRGVLGYAGDQINENVIQFVKGPGDKLFIRKMSFIERSTDSSENGMYRTVKNSNLQPIATTLDIKAYTPDMQGVVVDITDLVSGDNNLLFFDPSIKKLFGFAGFQADKSYIESIASFPVNLEIQTVKTYTKGDETTTYGLNTSLVLLPAEPMKPRYADERVGYFSRKYIDFDSPKAVEIMSMITRWRLEPREADKEKYLQGELVEPAKPIVYYVDPSTPKKWVPYLIQGVNDWQKAFEKAGFKNAIYALEAPTNDSTFNLYDARHNAIIYKPSVVPNASGPHVHDPRTGEILETHIDWYHNVMQLLHDWYMVQAGPNDPKARKMEFEDSLMGQLIRFVSSHEIGHTLGLAHNFGSSSTIPTDSLRSKAYVEKNGFCPSIMDYARFNYVAQPEDNFSQKDLFPKIGKYDEWAINWGYRWLPQLKTKEEERTYMNKWIIQALENDKQLWYGPQHLFVTDPRCQSEDLGDNAMKASYYGIQNLKRVKMHLADWTKEPNSNYSSLRRMRNEVNNQYQRYLGHVLFNIGLITSTPKTVEQSGPVLKYTSKEKQKEAVQFLQQQLFETPYWLIDKKEISTTIGGYGHILPSIFQSAVLDYLLQFHTYTKLRYFQTGYPNEAYTFEEFLTDLGKGIWKELGTKTPIDFCRRMVQKTYAEKLVALSSTTATSGAPTLLIKLQSDFLPIIHTHINEILDNINKALAGYKDKESRRHLIAIKKRLKEALDPKTANVSVNQQTTKEPTSLGINKSVYPFQLNWENEKDLPKIHTGCWGYDPIFFQDILDNPVDK